MCGLTHSTGRHCAHLGAGTVRGARGGAANTPDKASVPPLRSPIQMPHNHLATVFTKQISGPSWHWLSRMPTGIGPGIHIFFSFFFRSSPEDMCSEVERGRDRGKEREGRGEGGGGERERRRGRERETMIDCLQHKPWPGMEPTTQVCPDWGSNPKLFKCTGWCCNQARAGIHVFNNRLLLAWVALTQVALWPHFEWTTVLERSIWS